MHRSLLLPVVVLLGLVPVARADSTVEPAGSKALLQTASRLSRLAVQRPVPVVTESEARFRQRRLVAHDRAYPRSAQGYDAALYATLGLAGGLRPKLLAGLTQAALYDSKARAVYVPRRRALPQGALLEQFVHALQDQAFDLRRLKPVTGKRDASLAAGAALDGHAALLAGRQAVWAAPARGSPLTRFLALERGFAPAVGARFAVALRNLGGARALFTALRRFPETTEQVFHLDKFLEREQPLPVALPVDALGLRLVADDTFGELDVRALLAAFAVPGLERAGTGWGGGRSALYRAGGRAATVLALDWDAELDALEWLGAVRAYVDRAFDVTRPGPPPEAPCSVAACWELGPRTIAIERFEARTVLVFGPDPATAAGLAKTIVGLPVSQPRVEG